MPLYRVSARFYGPHTGGMVETSWVTIDAPTKAAAKAEYAKGSRLHGKQLRVHLLKDAKRYEHGRIAA